MNSDFYWDFDLYVKIAYSLFMTIVPHNLFFSLCIDLKAFSEIFDLFKQKPILFNRPRII